MTIRNDIVVDGTEYLLVKSGRGRAVQGSEVPEIATQQFVDEDVPIMQDTWHLGGFYTQRSVPGGGEHITGAFGATLVPGTYDYGQNAWALNPRMICAGPEMNSVTLSSANGSIRAAVEENGDLYLVGGSRAYRVAGGSAASTTLATHNDFKSSNVAVSAVPFLGDGYVGTVNSSNENSDLWKVSGTTWSTGADPHGYLTTTFYSTAAGAAPRWLAGMSTTNGVDFTAVDPLGAGSWGAEVFIREAGSVRINGLVSRQDHTYISTDRGLFDFDGATGNTLNLTPQVEKLLDNDNGIASVSHNGFVYYGYRRGILRYQTYGQDAGRVQDVTPGYGAPSENPVRGKVTALASWGAWVIAAVYNGTDTYICFGRDLQAGEASLGPSPMLWHPGVIYLPGATCYFLYVSGLTSPPTLWVGNGNNVKWGFLPRTENPLQDGEYRFATSFKFFTGANDWGYPAVTKDISEYDFDVENAGVASSMAVNTAQDGGSYGLLGTVRSSPRSTLMPTASVRGSRISERWDGSGTNTAGPVVRGVTRRADLLVRARERRQYTLQIAEWSEDKRGGRSPSDVGRTMRRLRALPDKGAIAMRDEFGDDLIVRVHRPISYVETEIESGDRRRARVVTVPLVVSVLKRLGTGFTWNNWHWNDGAIFS